MTTHSGQALARLAVDAPLRQTYSYLVPPALQGVLSLGHAVSAPFGGRSLTAYVVGFHDLDELDPGVPHDKLRPIERLIDPIPVFDEAQLALFRWMSSYYHAPLGEVISGALPKEIKGGTRTTHRASEDGVEALAANAIAGDEVEVLREVVRRPGLSRRGVIRSVTDLVAAEDAERALDRLLSRELVVREQESVGGLGHIKPFIRLRLHGEAQRAALGKGTPGVRQGAVLSYLAAHPEGVDLAELATELGPYARIVARRLIDRGIAEEELREARDAVVEGELPAERTPPTLNPAQVEAVAKILGPPRAWLLRGVTGSGKTEVYLHAAAEVLARGQQVLVLVPEIGLTPLLTGRFRARFGDSVAVLHSGLSGGQRLREWRRIRAGEAQVAVGARSALFAPFQRLGLVLVDEEHDDSYKQNDGVTYSGRDMAVVRAARAGCPVVLGTATPSFETWQNAVEGRYGLLELRERATPRPVPVVELVDLRQVEKVDGHRPLIAPEVVKALQACFDGGGQAIALFNRRGYATCVQCGDCGGEFACPSCGVSLVLHQRQRTLTCHYCGFHRPMPEGCPACGGALDVLGTGTERVEEALQTLFPSVPIGRMDADTTAVRGAHHRILAEFGEGRTRLLVGTQIVAKGHDFPGVQLAVVLGADHVLMMPDFRASERAWALLTQLAGRAGRGAVAGRVLVQTHHPEHHVFRTMGDPAAFFAEEERSRRMMRYPPFYRLALVRVEGADRDRSAQAAWALARQLRGDAKEAGVDVIGPAQSAMARLVGRWRNQIILRAKDAGALGRWLSRHTLSAPQGVRVHLDIDPRDLM
ncbi:MAG: primosomal protein N' [Deltaproteobacteria bacterium]|nr:primosomal protein N' [Deltaproteobacteria bacterium]